MSALAALALLAGCEGRPNARSDFEPGPVPAELAEGERLFNDNCARCHGMLGGRQ